ncbi:hypothetical protein LWI28_017109 [Acer negundo]|uniref:Uncharacterized protein n=1 Tax=Acer negundo TaxID=4023 RepID=A0AAD5NJS3_ACENE|nr:hypothetical protein LWI28_017109 [Acer negundo]
MLPYQEHGTVDGPEKHKPATIDEPLYVELHGPSDVNWADNVVHARVNKEAGNKDKGKQELEEGQGEGEAESEEHRFCVKHMYNNFKAQYKGLVLKQILWGAVKATTEQDFNHWIEKIKTESLSAYNWLAGKDAKHWSRVFFKETVLCDMVCNNMCEAFNVAILAARDKPIITMMEMIRNYLMTRLVRKRAELEKWSHQIGPKVFWFAF